jgi:hypothetical protein
LGFIRRQENIPEEFREQKKQRQDKKREILLSSGLLDDAVERVKEIRNVLDDNTGMRREMAEAGRKERGGKGGKKREGSRRREEGQGGVESQTGGRR